ncbi:phosphate ABC transporter substrate-binding protein (PhoT family) [Azospirillum brasilense]|uniref:Phosphate ABC transporter substrate-binding protein (PhoT family) n=1 Tax=Azospirillum brasilense TaxID=192 RepID=A0A560CSS6_AZOBR|nr:phosphate ABC transporter substrate-binding protein [Azospirillum brasilense]TWA87892.1 phosphate ABC transporter substrate-binding protein (PhoT family) [Azospirillum brasilense]
MPLRRTLVAALTAACLFPPLAGAAETAKLTVTGASTLAPLVSEIAHRFENANPGVRIDVQTGGSSRGVADVRRGIADIGMVSRVLKPDEDDLTVNIVARDGVGMIVNTANPVDPLSRDQVIGIYTGRITNWSQIGGPDRPITVVNKAEGRSTLDIFLEHVQLKPTDVKAHIVIGDNEQGVKVVAGNPWAIGYVSIGTAEYHAQAGTPVRLMALGPVVATTGNVANGTYGAARPLNLVTAKPPEGVAARFIAYSQSPAVHDLIHDQYFVPAPR